jgi:hypothetical protein
VHQDSDEQAAFRVVEDRAGMGQKIGEQAAEETEQESKKK